MLPGRLFASLALAVAASPAIAVGGVHANVYKLPSSTSTTAQPVSIAVDTSAAIGITHPNFVSFSFDTTALFGIQRTLIPFGDPVLQQLARNLAPSYVRFGGSLQDHVIMNVTGDIPTSGIPGPSDFIQLYMNASMWDLMIDFCSSAGLDLVYGLNAAIGRQTSSPATWNFTNVELLLKYIASKNQSVPIVELGNESNVYNCSGSSANISASQIYGQYATLRSTLKSLLPSTQVWGLDPSVTGDVKGQCHSWYGDDLFGYYRDFLALNNGTAVDSGVDRSPARGRSMLRNSGGATASRSAALVATTADLEAAATAAATMIDAVTWHYYPQVQSNVTSGIAQILSYEYQTRIQAYSNQAIASRDQFVSSLPIIMGETSSYWAGGLANVSNRYASGFWYLNQLGYLAASGYSVMIRQDLAGGDYGLLDLVCNATAPAPAEVPLGVLHQQPDAQVLGHQQQQQVQAQAQVQVDCNTNDTGVVVGYRPNPDYFTTALWKQLVGTRVLGVSDGYLVDNGSDASQLHEKSRRGSGDSDVDTSVGGDGGGAAASTSSSSASSSGVRVWAFCALPSSIITSESTRDAYANTETASGQAGGQTDAGSDSGEGSINANGDIIVGGYSAGDVVLVVSNLNDYNVSIDLDLMATRTPTSSPEGESHTGMPQRHPAPPQSTPTSVDLYILTPPPGEGLDSGLVCLNGNPAPLALGGVNGTSLPPFPPISLPWTTDVRSSSSDGVKERGDDHQKQHKMHQQRVQQPVITWPAQAYGFLVIKGASAAACTSA